MRVLLTILCTTSLLSLYGQITFSPEEALADSSLQYLITTEQDSLLGNVSSYLEPEITFTLQNGDELFFDESSVTAIFHAPEAIPLPEQIRSLYFSSYQDMFFSSSAYSIPEGRKQFASSQFVINQVQFGATNHYSIGVGYAFPFYLIARMKIASNKPDINYNMAAGINVLYSFNSSSEFPRAVHFYIASTIGHPDKYFNFNLGYGVNLNTGNDSPFSSTSRSAFIISGGGVYPVNGGLFILIDHLLMLKRNENLFFPGLGLSYQVRHHRIDMGYFYYSSLNTPVISAPGLAYKLNF